ncbi:MAG: tetratricopeptide repeat protein [Verrucomicrobiales bacterium]
MSELAHGLLLQDQGRLKEAEACYFSVLSREPENDFVHGRLALCQLSQEGKKREALDSIEKAIRLRPEDSFYHAIRSLILSDLRRGKEALAAADRAVGLDPENAFALVSKAAAYCSMDRWSDAEEWSRKALAADSDHAMAANMLTHSLRMQGRKDEHAAAVEQVLAADPEDSLAHVNAGWSALQSGDHRKAETHFREALRLDPDSEMAREGLIESFRARSAFYRLYLSYCFFMQRFTGAKQWGIIIGIYLVYQVLRQWLETVNPLLGGGFVLLWLAIVMWVWLAPGVGNFLLLVDRSARLALKRGERWQGLTVGLGLLLGTAGAALGFALGFDPALLAGFGLIASAVPASMTFGNDSARGRLFFGGITAFIYLVTALVFVSESVRHPAVELLPTTLAFGAIAILGAILCTWLGNVRSLRQGIES